MNGHVLALFARYPEPGKVKTRLAARIGANAACRVYEDILKSQIQEHVGRSYDFVVFVDPGNRAVEFARAYEVPTLPQADGDLSNRLADCLRILLQRHEVAAIAGSDIPSLTEARVEEAFEAARSVDAALGPCPDGGYYLIASRLQLDAFAGIPWGTDGVLQATLDRLRSKGYTWKLLPPERDVDEADDLELLDENQRHYTDLW